MKASQSIQQFPADVMPLQKSSGGLNWCPSIHPSTTEKISISLRPGLGLHSPIVERNYYVIIIVVLIFKLCNLSVNEVFLTAMVINKQLVILFIYT